MFEQLPPQVGSEVLEVGAGIGTFSARPVERRLELPFGLSLVLHARRPA